MTEVPGSVQTSRHALERSGTLLNAEYVHRWQHADGAYRQRARRLLSGLALWVGAVGALALAVWAAGRLRLGQHQRTTMGRAGLEQIVLGGGELGPMDSVGSKAQ